MENKQKRRVKNDINTKEILNSLIPAERRLEVYEIIKKELQERLVRLNHNNDVQDDIMIPELRAQKKDIESEQEKVLLQRRIDGLLDQGEENNMAFGSNHIALLMIDEKIEETRKEIEKGK